MEEMGGGKEPLKMKLEEDKVQILEGKETREKPGQTS